MFPLVIATVAKVSHMRGLWLVVRVNYTSVLILHRHARLLSSIQPYLFPSVSFLPHRKLPALSVPVSVLCHKPAVRSPAVCVEDAFCSVRDRVEVVPLSIDLDPSPGI